MSASGRLSSVRKEVVDLASSEDEVEMLQAASDTQASAARDPIQIVHSVGLLVEALEEVEEVEAVEDVWLHVEAEDNSDSQKPRRNTCKEELQEDYDHHQAGKCAVQLQEDLEHDSLSSAHSSFRTPLKSFPSPWSADDRSEDQCHDGAPVTDHDVGDADSADAGEGESRCLLSDADSADADEAEVDAAITRRLDALRHSLRQYLRRRRSASSSEP